MPKCTHAYAVSRSGAERIVRHLRSTSSGSLTSHPQDAHYNTGSKRASGTIGPSFAYGRALDQAFVRLIQGRRISAFSIVPSLIIQTKESPSDITPGSGGKGSAWRDALKDSALRRLHDGAAATVL